MDSEQPMLTTDDLLTAVRKRATDLSTCISARIPGLPTPALPPPATSMVLAATESHMALTLPSLLKRLYTEVADGGFGPGYGLISLVAHESDKQPLASAYLDFRAGGGLEKLLPLWDWGCAMWSCLDARSEEGAIVTSNQGELTVTPFTLFSWLHAWTNGVDLSREIFEPNDMARIGINPFTKKPMVFRGGPHSKGKKMTSW